MVEINWCDGSDECECPDCHAEREATPATQRTPYAPEGLGSPRGFARWFDTEAGEEIRVA